MKAKTAVAIGVLLSTFMIAAHPVRADGARDWENVPIDTNILFAYYTYSNTEASVEPSLPIEGVSVDAHVPIIRYARTFRLGSQVGGFQLIAPYGFVNARLDGTRFRTSTSGLGDIGVVLIANLAGAPALTRKEFAAWTPDYYLTASLGVTAPTGRYNAGLLNVGKNRWTFKPQLSYGNYFGRGGLLAVNVNVQLFTDNDENRAGRLQQAALLGIEAHASHDVGTASWVSFDAIYARGGETSVAGVDKENRQSTLRIGISGSHNLNATTAMSMSLTRSVARKAYTPASTNFSVNVNTVF